MSRFFTRGAYRRILRGSYNPRKGSRKRFARAKGRILRRWRRKK